MNEKERNVKVSEADLLIAKARVREAKSALEHGYTKLKADMEREYEKLKCEYQRAAQEMEKEQAYLDYSHAELAKGYS
jgi:hypothetical protein